MMKDYLLATFAFNDAANRKLLGKIHQLPNRVEAIRLFSHLINCQYKWMARIQQDPAAFEMSWWEPVYNFADLEQEWEKSLKPWLAYIASLSEGTLATELEYIGYDGARWAASPQDIALQLNYHSIHHRAQIQTMLRAQGIEPDFVDYIGTKARRLG